MNFIAGIMLLFLDEESAFWLLCALLEYILPADYYAQDLSGCNVDLRVFKYSQSITSCFVLYCIIESCTKGFEFPVLLLSRLAAPQCPPGSVHKHMKFPCHVHVLSISKVQIIKLCTK
jgi:hypothetical protein